MNLLIPVDGSQGAMHAVDYFLKTLAQYKQMPQVHLLNVQIPILSGNVRLFISQEKINEYYQEEGMLALKLPREQLDQANVSYHYHIGVGNVAETILRYAQEKKCDQIVIGSKRTISFLGSVVFKLLNISDVPVLIVK